MLSILIPTYNHNAFPLAQELHQQCLKSGIPFELLCFDDASGHYIEENKAIARLSFCRMEFLEKNVGRSNIRTLLAEAASHAWLLFLDADVLPVAPDFIKNYISQINEATAVLYGGLAYSPQKPPATQMLRWRYGKQREAVSVEKRHKNPYKTLLFSNLLIRKDTFLEVGLKEVPSGYGYEDLLFGIALAEKKIPVQHLQNPVYHLGLETSELFLEKSLASVRTLHVLLKNHHLDPGALKITHYFYHIRKWGLQRVFAGIFTTFEKQVRKNLRSGRPGLFLFDLYRLGYLCSLWKD